jgi:hypothetical protein
MEREVMRRRLVSLVLSVTVLLFAGLTFSAAPAAAQIEPPWCGTPEPDAAEALPSDPPLNFPHIPYYAIGCTLEEIQAESDGRMRIDVIGPSATGRDMFLVTINALDSRYQRKAFANWKQVRRDALTKPAKAQKALRKFDGQVKVPLFIQAGSTATSTRASTRTCGRSRRSPPLPTGRTRWSTRSSTTRSSCSTSSRIPTAVWRGRGRTATAST